MYDNISLKEGLQLFRSRNSKYFSKPYSSEVAHDFMESHDIAHVVFGCDTSLYGEAVVKIWTSLGTDQNIAVTTRGYQSAKAFHLFRAYSLKHILRHISRYITVISKVI
mgnify:CR=1 FL=1